VVPYQVFPVADGHLIIATGNDGQFARLCTVLGDPAIATDPLYLANADRVANRESLIARLSALTRRFTRAELYAALEAVNVPAGPINTVADVFDDPQVIARGMRLAMPSAAAEKDIPGVRTPIRIDGAPMASARPSPRCGEHTEEILREIGEAVAGPARSL